MDCINVQITQNLEATEDFKESLHLKRFLTHSNSLVWPIPIKYIFFAKTWPKLLIYT